MKKTDISFGSGRSTSGGMNRYFTVISDARYRDRMQIQFEHNQVVTKGEVRAYELHQLKKQAFFKKAKESEAVEKYVNTWMTRRTPTQIIKYATAQQQAFVFTAEDNLDEHYNYFFDISHRDIIEYWREYRFSQFINKRMGISVDQFRNVAEMNEQKFQLFYKNFGSFVELSYHVEAFKSLFYLDLDKLTFVLENSAKLNQLNYPIHELIKCQLNFLKLVLKDSDILKQLLSEFPLEQVANLYTHNKLAKILAKPNDFVKALKVATIKQILGITNQPKPIETEDDSTVQFHGMRVPLSHIEMHMSFSIGDFKCEKTRHSLKLSYEGKEFKIIWGEVKPEEIEALNKQCSQLPTMTYINKWSCVAKGESADKQKLIYYSSTTTILVAEIADRDFPTHKIKHGSYFDIFLKDIPLYEEIAFEKSILALGISLSQLRQLDGMSQAKLTILKENAKSLPDMVKMGVTIHDLSRTDSNRLKYIFKHFEATQSALEFITPQVLLGIQPVSPKLSVVSIRQGMFKPKTLTIDIPEEDEKNIVTRTASPRS